MISIQPVAESIMIRHIKFKIVLLLILIVEVQVQRPVRRALPVHRQKPIPYQEEVHAAQEMRR